MGFMKNINLATRITLARIALLPFILFFYVMAVSSGVGFFVDWGKLIALILFVVAAGTDWLDGYIARKYNMVTNTGKLLDPVADKMLTLIGFLLVMADPALMAFAGYWYWVAVVFVVIALGRETITNSLRFIAADQGICIAADKLGKIKTVLQFVTLISYILLAFNLNPSVQFVKGTCLDVWAWGSLIVFGLATFFTIWSCYNYIKNYIKSYKEKEETKKAE